MNDTIRRFHTYELTFVAVAFAATAPAVQNFLVDTNYDFWLFKQQAFIFDAAGLGISTLQWPNLEVLIQEGASQQQFSNQAESIFNCFGTGAIPFILPQPHVIDGGSNLVATVTNRHTATAFSVRLAFSGVHVAHGQVPSRRMRNRAASY